MTRARYPLLALGGLALLAALWGGLARLGWALPTLTAPLSAAHGPLALSGFLGTLISLERAAALGRPWAYAAPLLAGLGGLALVAGLPPLIARGLSALGGLGLAAVFLVIVRRRFDWPHAVMGFGALLWLAGSVLWWLGRPVFQVLPWWSGFLVLTIAGERLELARVLALRRRAVAAFLAAAGVFLAGLFVSLAAFSPGVRLGGLGLLALSLWFLRYDIARRTIRRQGLTRFIAACLLPGYAWLAIAGTLWLWRADVFSAGPLYDAMLHSLLLGFVFSMIFGHAPIIVPALLGVNVAFRPAFYLPLGLLHLSLLVRVSGALGALPPLRLWGGLLNVAAILLYIGLVALSVRRAPAAG